MKHPILMMWLALGLCACESAVSDHDAADRTAASESREVALSSYETDTNTDVNPADLPTDEAGWRERLTDEQYHVLREQGTEPAFRNKYWDETREGRYVCAGCGSILFDSDAKYKSGTGWPSFYQPAAAENIRTKADRSLGMVRTEVVCATCDGHLGHVFEDGPEPTGLRYCMNSAALQLQPREP